MIGILIALRFNCERSYIEKRLVLDGHYTYFSLVIKLYQVFRIFTNIAQIKTYMICNYSCAIWVNRNYAAHEKFNILRQEIKSIFLIKFICIRNPKY